MSIDDWKLSTIVLKTAWLICRDIADHETPESLKTTFNFCGDLVHSFCNSFNQAQMFDDAVSVSIAKLKIRAVSNVLHFVQKFPNYLLLYLPFLAW